MKPNLALRGVAVRRCRQRALLCVALFAVALAACSSDDPPLPDPGATASFTPVVALATPSSPPPEPTAAPTETPAPTPTPDPLRLVHAARRAAFDGDDKTAIALYRQALAEPLPEDAQLTARLELAQSQLSLADPAGALESLGPAAAQTITPARAADARVLMGRASLAMGDPAGAAEHFAAAIDAQSVISPYVSAWLGDAQLSLNQPVSAVASYQQAVDGAAFVAQEVGWREKLALAYQLSGQYQPALAEYEAILAASQIPSYRARILWESAQVLLAMGRSQEAFQRMREVMNTAPRTAAAFSALNALLNNGQSVDEVQRGIIGYYNGAHEAAREAFRRAIRADSRLNEIRYWAALNYIALRSPADAFRNLDQIIASGPESDRYGDALIRKGELQADLGNYEDAVATYRRLAATAPADPQAAQALLRAGRTFDRYGQIAQAADAYLAAQAAYPNAETAAEALLRGAIALYRLDRHAEAISATRMLLSMYPSDTFALLGQLWLGKAQISAGDVVSGQATLRALAEAHPDDYEGTRAAEILSGAPAPLSLPHGPAHIVFDSREQDGAEQWLRAWLGISETVDIRAPGPALQADLRFQRGNALWRLSFKAEAREAFEALRTAYSQDALATYQLALHFRDIGLYRPAISAADTLMRLSPAGTLSSLPAFLARLLYPQYYPDLVGAHAQEFGHDPLLIYSLIRQESLFEPFAASFASAYGLMQVIPPTGREIHGDLSWPDGYTERDLIRPFVSVRFGTYYLAKQLRFLDGDYYAALAAYNGGPGNSRVWKSRSGGDPDVFFMTISFDETQRYIRAIAANYAIYHRLYSR